MGSTTIEWTEESWNPVTGCTKISPGCGLGPDGALVGAGCYAERHAERFRGQPGFETGFDLRLRPEKLDEPAHWRKPRRIFVNSMSDLFHKDIPGEFIGRVFDTMESVPRHIYQVLTKRSSLMRDFVRARYGDRLAPPHIWLGVSIEDGLRKSRIQHLRETPASVRFLSIEPLIGPIGKLDLSGIHWVIVGGESGPGFRPMKPEWAREVRDQCVAQGVPFFFKQWGGVRPKSGGRMLDGRECSEYPPPAPARGRAMDDRPATRRIDAIVVGVRHRKAMGDVVGLAASIREVGLLHPVVITPDGRLIAGERRLEACRSLGWREIPTREVDLAEIVRGELAENTARKDFLPSEIEAIRRALAPEEKAAAKERQGARHDLVENFHEVPTPQKTRDRIGAFAGVSGRTVEKIAAVVAAAEAEPARFGKLAEDMDRNGRVDAPYRRLRNIKAAEAIRAESPPLPGKGPYRGGITDFPWAYELLGEPALTRGVLPYPTMTLAEACAFPVPSLLEPDAAVGVWVTNLILLEGLHVELLKAWGLKAAALITWPKEHAGRGHWAKGQTEHLILATRGKPTVTLTDQTTLLKGPFHLVAKGAHSAKPIEAYDWFESLIPAARYFDLFSRHQHNERWHCHGYEAPAAPLAGELAAE